MAARYGSLSKYQGAYGDSSRLVGLSLLAPSGLRAASFYFALQGQQANRAAARRAASDINTAAGLFAALYAWNIFSISFFGNSQSVSATVGPESFYVSFQGRF
jgi:hypothetical protein